MGKDSRISWTDHTFNPWWGCVKVSPACTNCYAETFSRRVGESVWGAGSGRRFFGEKHWNEPLRWNREASPQNRRLVFCASMADVFEDRRDLDPHRERLWDLVKATPNLVWLLLTKRIELVSSMVPSSWIASWPENVWPGTTTETQEWFDKRHPFLDALPARIKWISVEPMLGPLTMGERYVDWVIVGGESGANARPMKREWVSALRDECRRTSVKFHFKQKGNVLARSMGCRDISGKNPSEWPDEFKVQEFPALSAR